MNVWWIAVLLAVIGAALLVLARLGIFVLGVGLALLPWILIGVGVVWLLTSLGRTRQRT